MVEDFLVLQATPGAYQYMSFPLGEPKWLEFQREMAVQWTLQKVVEDKANSRCPWSS